jgi:hypothetical protein
MGSEAAPLFTLSSCANCTKLPKLSVHAKHDTPHSINMNEFINRSGIIGY